MSPPLGSSAPAPAERKKKSPTSSQGLRLRTAAVVAVIVESAFWSARRDAKAVVRRAIIEAACVVSAPGEVAVVLTDDAAIRRLNRKWRSKNAPTNVLSFPASNGHLARRRAMEVPASSKRPAKHGITSGLLGDVVIAYETTQREARAEHKPFAHHLAHLAVHGYLHLVGYDHQANDEAQEMEGLETEILARLDVPNPYIARRVRG
jgi:probable rRNA maturation factor